MTKEEFKKRALKLDREYKKRAKALYEEYLSDITSFRKGDKVKLIPKGNCFNFKDIIWTVKLIEDDDYGHLTSITIIGKNENNRLEGYEWHPQDKDYNLVKYFN